MKSKITLLLTLILFSLQSFAQMYDPVSWTIEQKSTSSTTADIIIKAKLEKGWHLYGLNIPPDGPVPTKIVIEQLDNAKKEGSIKAKSKLVEVHDPNFDMKLNWYSDEAVFVQKISFTDPAAVYAKVSVSFMVCDDKSCLPPSEEILTVGKQGVKPVNATPTTESEVKPGEDLLATTQPDTVQQPDTTATALISTTPVNVEKLWTPVIDELRNFGTDKDASSRTLLWVFIMGFLGGLIALFTPCVWPIIPMTVSFFLKRNKDTKKGRRDAIFYGLAIIVIYVSLGLLITAIFGASALNSLATNAVFNLLFFALLVVFAIAPVE